MPLHLRLFYSGLLLYAASFFLLATGSFPPGDGRMLGFLCAFYAFALPIELGTKALFHNVPMPIDPVAYLSLLIAGWINPVFVVTAFLSLTQTHQRLVAVLKAAVVLMILFTLLFFATFKMFYPREGYFAWLVGMLLALFSGRIADRKEAWSIN